MDKTSNRPRVAIIGGGFGGIAAARALAEAPVDITLIDRRNYHLFQPLLYQVAMAGLSPNEIAYPIRSMLSKQANCTVVLDEVRGVDLANRRLQLIDNALPYDYLILATGSQNSFFGRDEWKDYAMGLKDVDDAVEIRRRVLLSFETAENESDPEKRKRLLTFVLIGGGPTGVELAGALSELAHKALARDFRHIDPSSAEIILLNGSDQILAAYPADLAHEAASCLRRLGVQIRSNARVTNITADGVEVGSQRIPSATVIWAGGVSGTPLAASLGVKIDRAGRIEVEKDLSVPGHRNVFAIGDACVFLHQDGKPLPGLAPAAMQQGKAAAQSILDDLAGRKRSTFHYHHKGSLATIGRKAAIADFGAVRLKGAIAWWAWLFIHIYFLIGFRNRLIVLLDWLWSYVSYQLSSRLITGHRMTAGVPRIASGTAVGQPAATGAAVPNK